MNMEAEGYFASRGIAAVCENKKLELPIAKAIYEILWKGKGAKNNFRELEKLLK